MKFSDLPTLDAPTVVLTGLAFDESGKNALIEDMNTFFTEELKFLQNGSKIVNIEKIEGNILGDKGRTDVLLTLDKFDVNPISRLRFPDLKWTSDFIKNFRGDYE